MSQDSLWFISENDEVISVFSERERAQEERFYLKEENPLDKYKVYSISLDELTDYPDELQLALEEDLVEEEFEEDDDPEVEY